MKHKPYVRMLGRRINIEYLDRVSDDDGDKLHGDFCADKLTIRVDKTLTGTALESTILHELLHAALHLTGHGYRLSGDDEEALVRGLEHALIDVVKLK